MEKDLKNIYDIIGQVLVEEIQLYLVSKKQLLKRGGLVDSFERKIRNNRLEILSEDYYEYYINGRRPFAKKVPIFSLIKWIKRYRFKVGKGRDKKGRFISDTSYAFAIQNAIYKYGVKKKEDVVSIVLKRNNKLIDDLIQEELGRLVDKEIERII
jgi:hypothetical protein